MSDTFAIDCDFPGGNILVDRVDGDHVFLRQDLRDTTEWWSYWCFRVRGAQGRTLTFTFTNKNVFGDGGAAISRDLGVTWAWLPAACFAGESFTFSFAGDESEIRFSFAMPYSRARLDAFLAAHRDSPRLVVEHHATTRKGRDNIRLRLGQLERTPMHRVLLTCRHHCCEMMASYALEGILDTALGESETGNWLAENVEFLVVPMVDLDGVEDGDQGKCRAPHDHNRDYGEGSLYPTTRATKDHVPVWSGGRLRAMIDLHCPWIRGEGNNLLYQVGKQPDCIWEEQGRFGRILERRRRGSIPYGVENDLPFGQGWNTGQNYKGGAPFGCWAATLSGVKLVTTFEIPYGVAGGVVVDQGSATALGVDLAGAIAEYLRGGA